MSEVKHIDYVGFTFNGVHSSSLGIVRTSEGSRFNENLLPTIQDKTVQVPGGDGMYHFGSYYTQKQFNISYAFDALTEAQLARIKTVFGDKKIHELIFDETPYKKYYAKVTGSASIKHIPFAEGATNRVYKGEGSIQFTAYDPYAYSVKKYLNQYNTVTKILQPETNIRLSEEMYLGSFSWDENNLPIPGKTYRITYNDLEVIDVAAELIEEGYHAIYFGNEKIFVEYHLHSKDIEFYGLSKDAGKVVSIKIEQIEQYKNLSEWKDAAGLLTSQDNYDNCIGNAIKLYNPGVKETDFILKLNFYEQRIPGGKLMIQVNGATLEPSLEFNTIQAKIGRDGKADSFVCFNTKLNLIEGYKNIGDSTGDIFVKSGLIYNEYISGGTFFKIPQTFDFSESDSPRSIQLIGDGEFLNQRYYRDISYDYIYF